MSLNQRAAVSLQLLKERLRFAGGTRAEGRRQWIIRVKKDLGEKGVGRITGTVALAKILVWLEMAEQI
jgi:hypothetical protein